MAVLAVAGALAAAWMFWPSDARRVERRLHDLAEAVSVPSGEAELGRVARLAQLAQGLAPDVTFDRGDGSPQTVGRDTLVGLASRLGAGGAPLEVEVDVQQVTVDEAGAEAEATAMVSFETADATTRRLVAGEEVTFVLRKIAGEWLVAGITVVPAIRRVQ
jgi:hypothetical protein